MPKSYCRCLHACRAAGACSTVSETQMAAEDKYMSDIRAYITAAVLL
jgi:hypothetical protein